MDGSTAHSTTPPSWVELLGTGDYDKSDFDADVSSNLRSVSLSLKYELGQMQRRNPCGGAIVNTSSVNGPGGVANAALYAMSKAGILALTKSTAQAYAAHGIRVKDNALAAQTQVIFPNLVRMVGKDKVADATDATRYVNSTV